MMGVTFTLCRRKFLCHEGHYSVGSPATELPPNLPLLQIGHNHAVDASQKEEVCCLARLMMAVTASGSVTAMVKEGQGSLDPDSVTEMMQVLMYNLHYAS